MTELYYSDFATLSVVVRGGSTKRFFSESNINRNQDQFSTARRIVSLSHNESDRYNSQNEERRDERLRAMLASRNPHLNVSPIRGSSSSFQSTIVCMPP